MLTIPTFFDTVAILRDHGRVLAERILGLMDRNPTSPTYGCCDRYYWRYKLHDLANARFQEAALFGALILPCCSAAHREGIADIARSAIRFWEGLRHSDGSVDEAYPFERSFCATSMSTQAVMAASDRLGGVALRNMERTGCWLANHANDDLTNQMAGACLSLFRIGNMLQEPRFIEAARHKLDVILRRQLPSGAYDEYGGPDVGYATITLSLLAQYADESGDMDASASMRRCESWLATVVGPDGLFDWRATSRRTQFLYPFGLAWLGSGVLDRLVRGLRANIVPSPLWLDDRYSIPLAIDYLLAAELLEKRSDLPCA